ncbi:MAG: hypothetical protein NTW65_05640 [Deltaproteobacteria bacterium]|nr:hypothetical protein [Deltaproteobacteria bacterium]
MKEKNGRSGNKPSISFIVLLVFVAVAVISINACGYFGLFGEASWKEEVLLHDGSKIIVKRWQKRGGSHSLGSRPAILEYSINFKLPNSKKTITWKDGPTDDIGRANFSLVALHIMNNTPYIITTTYGCLAYNKWGRPNPPYVIFKFENNVWKRIELPELPLEFKNVNLVIDTLNNEEKFVSKGLLTAEMVKELNKSLPQEEYKTIGRRSMRDAGCPVQIYAEKGVWFGEATFKSQPSYEACVKFCNFRGMSAESCPCKRFFNSNKKGE